MKITQNERILDYLETHETITPMEALYECGVMRLASRIADLKTKGYAIQKETIEVATRYGKTHVARYRLIRGASDGR